jgi:hypothetical protein
VAWARRISHPAVDLRPLRRGQSALALWLCVLTSVAMFSALFLLPVLVQNIQGYSALESGLVLLPQGLVMGISAKIGMSWGKNGRLRPSIFIGLFTVGTTTGLMLLTTVDTPLWLTALIMAGRGVGIGLVVQPLLAAMLAGLSQSQLADANTVFSVAQRLGGSIGVSLMASYFAVRVGIHAEGVLGPNYALDAVGSLADAPPGLRPQLANASLAGFHDTMRLIAAMAAVAVVFALFLRPRKPDRPRARNQPTRWSPTFPHPAARPCRHDHYTRLLTTRLTDRRLGEAG